MVSTSLLGLIGWEVSFYRAKKVVDTSNLKNSVCAVPFWPC